MTFKPYVLAMQRPCGCIASAFVVNNDNSFPLEEDKIFEGWADMLREGCRIVERDEVTFWQCEKCKVAAKAKENEGWTEAVVLPVDEDDEDKPFTAYEEHLRLKVEELEKALKTSRHNNKVLLDSLHRKNMVEVAP